METIIKESRAVSLMKEYLKENFPALLEPFVKSTIRYDYNSSRWNDEYYTISICYRDKFDKGWIIENDNKDPSIQRYEVDEKLETMYDLFGQELFELFFLEVHGIDLKDKGVKHVDWGFI